MTPPLHPVVNFYRLIEHTKAPRRADRSAEGTLPTRASRYCEAVTSATAFGWWVFPPTDLDFFWDGFDIFWKAEGITDWLLLSPSAQYPGFPEVFDAAAPPELHGCAPPMLTALPEPGTLQIWSGLIARTAPGWHLLVRSPANFPMSGGLVLYEGIVAADTWCGPLFVNLRLTRSHSPVRLHSDVPLCMLQPVLESAYSEDVMSSTSMAGTMAAFDRGLWDDYRTSIVLPNMDPGRPFGNYAVRLRKQRHASCTAHTAKIDSISPYHGVNKGMTPEGSVHSCPGDQRGTESQQ